jgi:hypothetical protein
MRPWTPSARIERAEMTFATGLIDAASYLGLGHVFTANMTGNIVLLGHSLERPSRRTLPGDTRGTQQPGTEDQLASVRSRTHESANLWKPRNAAETANNSDAGGGTRTPDTRIMIGPRLAFALHIRLF